MLSPPWGAGLTLLGLAAGVLEPPLQYGGEMLAVGQGVRRLGVTGKGQEDLKLSLGLPLLRLSQAGALLQTTQAHAEIIFTGSAI